MGRSTFPLPRGPGGGGAQRGEAAGHPAQQAAAPADFDAIQKKLQAIHSTSGIRQVISYCLYPQVVEDFLAGYDTYGDISQMPSDVFFYGMARGESMEISIEEGKTLMIKYIGPGERGEDGTIELQFELNGSRRNVTVADPAAEVVAGEDPPRLPGGQDRDRRHHHGGGLQAGGEARRPGEEGQVVAIIEAMKMETGISAAIDGTVDEVFAAPGDIVQAGQLLLKLRV